jgi:tetratricopeptide (TPR) repeat protein
VAESLERLYPDQVEEQLGVLARHWERAGDVEQAVRYLRRAGEQAASRFANAEAAAYYTRALDLTPAEDTEGRCALLLAREAVHNVQGEREAQDQDLAALEDLALLLGDRQRAEVAARRAHHAVMTGDYAGGIAAGQAAARLGEAAGDAPSQAAGHRQWGRALWRQSKYAEAQVQYERALALAREAQLLQEQAYCMRQLGLVTYARDDIAGALAYHEQALQVFEQIGDRRGQGMSLRDLAWCLAPLGDVARSLHCLQESLRICRETGDRRDEGWALFSLGHYHWFAGDFEKALSYYKRSRPLMHGTDPMGESMAFLYSGLVYIKLGDYSRAQEALEQMLHIRHEFAPDEVAYGLAVQALLSHYLGRDEDSLEYCRQVQRLTQDPEKRSSEALTLLGRTLTHLGQLAEAADALAQASELWPEKALSTGQQYADLATECYAGQARVYLARGEPAPALACVEKLLPHIEAHSALPFAHEPLEAYLSCYRVLRAHGDPRAGPLLRAACDLLQEQASKIEDPALRRSFLENVPANREIASLYAQQP